MKDIPKKGDTIVCWFSCGAASAVAAKKTIEKYGDICTIRVVNNPIKEEDHDNLRFLKDCEKWLGLDIEFAYNPDFLNASCVEVWDKRKYMSGVYGAPCTHELKKKARQYWESHNKHDWLVLGFTSEEEHRYKRFKMTERENLLGILIDDGISKADCFLQLMGAGIELPNIYKRGYPNANCIGCVKAGSTTYWNHVRVADPEVFEQRVKQSREIGTKLVKVHPKHLPFCRKEGKIWFDNRSGEQLTKVVEREDGKLSYKTPSIRIFLDELPKDVIGRPMKNLDFECGIFCEEM